ncbi:substrate-binding periplasmic protein [Devosia sp.]|uniref:substrate-binding periplasmic protein n=1 Tax=Devosia sp. TaxID=1871048 RepID=UPI002F114F1B
MSPAFTLPRLANLLTALALALLMAALWQGPVAAQAEPEFFDQPFAPGQWNIGRRLDQSELRYCVDQRDPDWEVAGAVADAIAAALLLEPRRYVVESDLALEDITKVYEVMLKHCDAHMGFKLIPEGYANWVTLSRAYYDAQYVFVTTEAGPGRLADLAAGRPIGATIGTSAHIRLASYLSGLPAEKRWPVYPMGNDELALEALVAGKVDVALVWAPALWARQRAEPAYAGIHAIDPAPLPPTTLGVGALLLADQVFLRTAIDQAIAALSADGTFAQIYKRFDFPATPAP